MNNFSSSNTSLREEEFFRGVTSSFFSWILYDFLHVAFIVIYIFFAVVGIFLNIVTIFVSFGARLYKESVHAFIIQLCLVDLVACVFVLLPTLASVATENSWFSTNDGACRFQEIMFTWCMLLTFGCLVVGIVERVIRITDNDIHLRWFGNICIVCLVSVSIWVVDFLIAVMTLTAADDIGYRKDQYQCALDYASNPVFMHVIFTFTMYLPPIICAVSFTVIFYKRGHAVIRNSPEDQSHNSPHNIMKHEHNTAKMLLRDTTCVFYIDLNEYFSRSNKRIGAAPVGQIKPETEATASSKVAAKTKWVKSVKRITKRSKFIQTFQDKFADLNHHQSMTHFVTWSIVTFCWWLYFTAALIHVYGNGCSACYRIGVFLGLATYCLKPLVYIGHNRWYRGQCWKQMQNVWKHVRCYGTSGQ